MFTCDMKVERGDLSRNGGCGGGKSGWGKLTQLRMYKMPYGNPPLCKLIFFKKVLMIKIAFKKF